MRYGIVSFIAIFWHHVHLEYPKNRRTNRKYILMHKIKELLDGKFRKKYLLCIQEPLRGGLNSICKCYQDGVLLHAWSMSPEAERATARKWQEVKKVSHCMFYGHAWRIACPQLEVCTNCQGQKTLFSVTLGLVRLDQFRLSQVRLGQVRLGQVRLGQVRLGTGNCRVSDIANCNVRVHDSSMFL